MPDANKQMLGKVRRLQCAFEEQDRQLFGNVGHQRICGGRYEDGTSLPEISQGGKQKEQMHKERLKPSGDTGIPHGRDEYHIKNHNLRCTDNPKHAGVRTLNVPVW